MARGFLGTLTAIVVLAGGFEPAQAEARASARQLVDEAIRALDDRADVRAFKGLSFNARLLSRDIVEGEHAGEPYIVTISFAAIKDDLSGGYGLVETKDPATGQLIGRNLTRGQTEQLEAISGGKSVGRQVTLASPGWEARDPFRALRLADKAADLRREPDEMLHDAPQAVVSFTTGGVRVKLSLDARTKLITATQARLGFSHATSSEIGYNAMGDVLERTEFQLWKDSAGLRYPTQWDTYRNDIHLQTMTVDGPPAIDPPWDPADVLSSQAVDQAARLAASDLNRIPLNTAVANAPDPRHGIEEIAPGVVQIPGSWFTTLVRQDDGIVVIDAPISSGYSAQVIEEAQRRFPGVPIKAVITSTAFFWHVAGIREYAARGIPIYVRDANESTLRRIIGAAHTLTPDRFARHPVKPVLRPVSGRIEIGRGLNRLVVMPIGLATEPMLMTYLPDARLLHTGEMLQPLGPGGAFLHPESLREIRDSVLSERLPVDRLIGMHMTPRPWSDLEAAIAKAGV